MIEISYPVTPTLSVEADHETLMVDEVIPLVLKPPGTDGAVVSAGAAGVLTAVVIALYAELPAELVARTRKK